MDQSVLHETGKSRKGGMADQVVNNEQVGIDCVVLARLLFCLVLFDLWEYFSYECVVQTL